jgi:hypothetical protein
LEVILKNADLGEKISKLRTIEKGNKREIQKDNC